MRTGLRLGPYEIVAAIGAGGMGEVYRARDTRLGREVAIKVLPAEFASDPDRLRRFEQEARAVAALDHPNILAIHDVGTCDGTPYIVTELLEGDSLRDRLRAGKLPPRKAVQLALQIARGLAAAHEKGIIHRDLKPENAFLTKDGTIKILDFGLAKLAHPETDLGAPTAVPPPSTEAGTVSGTYGYMSPEQARGLPLDERTDIFSFGSVLYEMLAGQRAFLRGSAADTISALLHDDPPTLPAGVPGSLEKIVDRCLERECDDRFSSARDLAFALEAVGNDPGPRKSNRGGVDRRKLTRRWAVLAVLTAGAVVIGAFWLSARRGPTPLPQFHPQRVSVQPANVIHAAVSPDGSEVAYAAEDGAICDIWVADIRGGRPIRLTEGTGWASGPTWFPDGGSVAYTLTRGAETSLWRVPRLGGQAMPLIPAAQDAAISPDGRQIAFSRKQPDSALRVWTAPMGALDRARQLTTDRGGLWDHRHPAWSPDVRTICYEDAKNLWLVPSEGGASRRFTDEDGSDRHPAWSVDGRSIYFVAERGRTRSLWRQSLVGGGAVRVTRGVGSEESPTISRDGRRIVFLSGLDTWSETLADLASGTVDQLGRARRTAYAAFAPDRRSIVYAADLAGSWDLWRVALSDNAVIGEPVRLTDHPGDCGLPTFSPDGRWIVYFRVVDGQRDIWVIPAEGGAPVNFTLHSGVNTEPAWSPDGREIAFVSNRSGWHQIWVAGFADGHRIGESRRITSEEGDASSPTWSPDGKSVAYVLATNESRDVRVVASDGGASHELTSGANVALVRWWWAKNVLVVSGFWGEGAASIRLLAPDGGTATPLVLPAGATVDPRYPDFELSSDGRLLALLRSTRQGEIWVLEADQGVF